MKLYTRTGDEGDTGLFDGSRVRKDHPRIVAYGSIDELNAHIGLAVAMMPPSLRRKALKLLRERLLHVQNDLFDLGAELATPEDSRNRARINPVTTEEVGQLETWIDEAVAPVAALRSFILPGGDALAAQLHICRTVCRRAERELISMMKTISVNLQVLIYLNRLSDLLFAWARLANHLASVEDVPWVGGRTRRPSAYKQGSQS